MSMGLASKQIGRLTIVDLVAVASFTAAVHHHKSLPHSCTSATRNIPGTALVEDLALKPVDQLKLEAEQAPQEPHWASLEVGARMQGLAAVARTRGLATAVASSSVAAVVAVAAVTAEDGKGDECCRGGSSTKGDSNEWLGDHHVGSRC
jgi:hypothetical protein